MKKKSAKKKYKELAWKEFSIFIRRRDLDIFGWGTCCTCGKVFAFNQLQAGHFLPSRTNYLLFHEDLVHAQCEKCNTYEDGNREKYMEFMINKYGQSKVLNLINNRNISIKYTEQDYKEIYEKYKKLNKRGQNDL